MAAFRFADHCGEVGKDGFRAARPQRSHPIKALRVLISSRADVTAKDGFGASPHHWAAFSNNVEGIKALCMAGCSPTDVNMLGYSPFRVAASVGRVDALRALLPYTPKDEIDLALHAAMLQGGGSAEVGRELNTTQQGP